MDLIYSLLYIYFSSVIPLARCEKKQIFAFHIDFRPFFPGIWFIQPDNQNAELSSWMDFNVWGFIYTLGSNYHQISDRERVRTWQKKTTQQHRVQLENLFLSVVRFFFSCLPVLSCWCETSNASLLWHWWYLQWTFYSLYVILLDILPRFCQTSRHILSDIITENMK